MFKLVWAGTVPWILNLLRMTKAGEGHGSHWSRQGARTWLGGAIFQETWDHGVTWWLRWEKDGRDPKGTLEEHLLFRKGWEGFRSKLLIRVDRLSVWIQIGSPVFIFSRIFFLFLELYYSSWDFLSNSLCLLHNFGLPFSYLANSTYCFFLNWVTCHWKLSSFCSKSKLVDTFWQIDAWSLNVSFAECMKPLVSSAVCCFQISSSPPRDLAVSLPPVVLLVWQYQTV